MYCNSICDGAIPLPCIGDDPISLGLALYERKETRVSGLADGIVHCL